MSSPATTPVLDGSAALNARLALLADGGALTEVRVVAEVTTAAARIHGVPVRLFGTDATIRGGALSLAGCGAVCAAYDLALAAGEPVVGLWQSGGARLDEGADSLHGVGLIFAAMTRASGRVPQVSLVLGAAAGGAAYGPALTDVVVLAPDARLFVTGPDVVRRVTGEQVTAESLGGPRVHARHSGVAHLTPASEAEAVTRVRDLVGLLARPSGPHAIRVPAQRSVVDPGTLLPAERRRAYDVRPLLGALLDEAPLELHARWAPNLVTALGRLDGRAVGVVATNPLRMGGCLTARASDKGARFVRLCDAFGLPIVVVVDVPGYLPGGRAEEDGIVRRGAKLLHAFAATAVPTVTLITRKAYGGAYIALNSRALGATRVLAWPGAEVDVMAAPAAVEILHRRALAELTGPGRTAAVDRLADRHEASTGGLSRALAGGYIDEVVAPADTRAALIAALAAAPAGRAQLTNIPL
jgi:acetyl-CoA/propionyl-CoA carboxylase carboxyl transferase subunit